MAGRVAALAVAIVLALLAAGQARAESYQRLAGHGGPLKGVAVSADGGHALTASFDYAVGYWDIGANPPRLVRWLEGHRAAVNAVLFHPDGRRAVSAGDDFDLIVWDLGTGGALHRLSGHEGKVLGLALAPDGRTLASAGWDGRIGLWDIDSGERLRWLEGHGANVNDVRFSDDGETLWSASYDGTVRAWPVRGGEPTQVVSNGFGVNNIVLDEQAGWLAYGAVDGTVKVLDLGTGAELADLTADRRPILALALSPDGGALAIGDGQGYIMVANTDGWSIARDFRAAAAGPIWALGWAGPGRLLAGGMSDEAAIWPVDAPEDAAALFAEGARTFHKDPAEMSNGERQFVRKCSVCHTLTPDGGHRAGPSLHGLFGRPAGSLKGYRYSEALAGSGIVWTEETVGRLFDEGPDSFTPGSKMPLQRITRPEDRADLIAYLKAEAGAAADRKEK